MLDKIKGYKTYIGMIGLGVLGICTAQGWIDKAMAATLGSILAAWTGVSLRQAMKNPK